MKRRNKVLPFLFISLFAAVSTVLYGQSYHTLTVINTLREYYPRYENSAGEKRTIDLITGELDKLGADWELMPLDREAHPSGSFNIRARSEGTDPGLGTVIFAVPLNHPFGAGTGHDYSAGIATALSILRSSTVTAHPRTIEVLFLGGEFPAEGSKNHLPRGSAAFLETFYPSEEVMFIYLNIREPAGRLAVVPAGSGKPSPSWLYLESEAALEKAGIPYRPAGAITRLYRLNLQDDPSPIDPYLEAGYPAIELRSEGEGTWSGPEEREAELLISSLAGDRAIPSYRDSHYLIASVRGTSVLIPERHYIIFLLTVFAAAIAYPVFAAARFKKYLRTLFRHIWSIPLIVAIMFLFLFLATILMQYIAGQTHIDELWKLYPLTFLWFKIAVSALLFILSQRLFDLLPFSRRGSFYSASALFFILADILIVSFFDIDLTAFLISTFIFIFLFTTVRERLLKVLFFLLSTVPVIFGLYGLFDLPAYRAIHFILLSPLTGNLLVAVHLLPFLLMLLRLRFLFHHPSRSITIGVTVGLEVIMLFLAVFFGTRIIRSDPYAEGRRQPLEIAYRFSMEKAEIYVDIESPAPIGNISLFGKTVSGRNASFSVPAEEPPLDMVLEYEPFLDRRSFRLTVSGEGVMSVLNVSVESGEQFTVMDASRQWSMSAERTSAFFAVENYPVLPFSLEFTLPERLEGKVAVEAVYAVPPVGLPEIDPSRFDTDTSFRLTGEIGLE